MAKVKTCSVKHCGKPARKFGKCWDHYNEWNRESQQRYNDKQRNKPQGPQKQPHIVLSPLRGTNTPPRQRKPLERRKKANKRTSLPARTKGHDKSRREYKQVIIKLGTEWEDTGANYCWECGVYVPLIQFKDGDLQPNYTAFAHVVSRGECGGAVRVVNDPENLVCMCGDCHTKMDQGGGTDKTDGTRWLKMKCRDRLVKVWIYIRKKYNLK